VQALEQAIPVMLDLAKKPGEGRFWSDKNEDFYSVSVPFEGGPWSVVASMPKAEIRVTWAVGIRLVSAAAGDAVGGGGGGLAAAQQMAP
jgi:hypothetical protein